MDEQQQQRPHQSPASKDPFLLNYQPSELRIASEFFTNWLPFLSKDLCNHCTQLLSDRIRSIDPESSHCDGQKEVSNGSDGCNGRSNENSDNHDDNCDTHSIGSWKDGAEANSPVETPSPRMSWADMAQEDEFGEEEHEAINGGAAVPASNSNLEEEMGKKGELKDRTFSAPQKWMRGKGRQTIQFGCCYNYAVDRDGNPPGILKGEMVDPIPDLFKVIIRRLIRWHVLPPTCVPDSCIVNIYEEGDCIPPHIDNHDFVRPFCTVSFLSECNILFGSNLKVIGPGEFDGSLAIPLPVGSVLVLNGNGADVAKHCVPAVPTKRISITFRRMDPAKRPMGFVPEPDLQGIQPLTYDNDKEKKSTGSRSNHRPRRHRDRRGGRNEGMGSATRNDRYSEPRESNQSSQRSSNRWSRGRPSS
ncbi:hypothetical protein PIB30_019473 [Stylosanthes scabra]|uniref:Fe2OG dioxygenase domain-containing protein n=1 Tax=Stylosanthes scabra TaxID=79078 RepID=A0ABU6T9X6_9FABA|nr:hypothetical protein [Stylosanthes scabra]